METTIMSKQYVLNSRGKVFLGGHFLWTVLYFTGCESPTSVCWRPAFEQMLFQHCHSNQSQFHPLLDGLPGGFGARSELTSIEFNEFDHLFLSETTMPCSLQSIGLLSVLGHRSLSSVSFAADSELVCIGQHMFIIVLSCPSQFLGGVRVLCSECVSFRAQFRSELIGDWWTFRPMHF